MRDTQAALAWMVNILNRHKIPFQISGGFAARFYGSKRELADIDFQIPEDRFDELIPEIKEYIKFGPAIYKDANWELRLATLKYMEQEIDIAGAYEAKIFDQTQKKWVSLRADLSKAIKKKIYGIDVPIVPKQGLISYKSKLLREVDIIDIRELSA